MTVDDIVIRAGRREDANVLLPLINRAGEGIPEHIWTQMAKPGQDPWEVGRLRFEDEESPLSYRKCWVAEAGGSPAGCLFAQRQPDAPDPIDPEMPSMFVPLQELENEAPGTGYVHILSTRAEMRGRGIGTRLLAFAEERYRGPNGMSLIVADNNAGARRLYARCGYVEAARRKMVKNGWQSAGAEWILLVKP